jgi:hypothetical protein
MLDELATAVMPGTHAVRHPCRPLAWPPPEAEPPLLLRLDRRGWHTAKKLTILTTITPVFLPPLDGAAVKSPSSMASSGLALPARALPLIPALKVYGVRTHRR